MLKRKKASLIALNNLSKSYPTTFSKRYAVPFGKKKEGRMALFPHCKTSHTLHNILVTHMRHGVITRSCLIFVIPLLQSLDWENSSILKRVFVFMNHLVLILLFSFFAMDAKVRCWAC